MWTVFILFIVLPITLSIGSQYLKRESAGDKDNLNLLNSEFIIKPDGLYERKEKVSPKILHMDVMLEYCPLGFRPEVYVNFDKVADVAKWSMPFEDVLSYCEYYFKYGKAPVPWKMEVNKNSSAISKNTLIEDKFDELQDAVEKEIHAFDGVDRYSKGIYVTPYIKLSYFPEKID